MRIAAAAAASVPAAECCAALGTDVGLAVTVQVLLVSAYLELYLIGSGVNAVEHVLVGLSIQNHDQIGCIRLNERHNGDWHTLHNGLQCCRSWRISLQGV